MILLHIVSSDKKQIESIADFLLDKKLIIDSFTVEQGYLRKKNIDNVYINEKQYLMIAKTKALLFETIDQKLRKQYSFNMPMLYSVPIVNMDWEQSRVLQDAIAKV